MFKSIKSPLGVIKRILETVIIGVLILLTLTLGANCALRKVVYPLKYKEEVISSADTYGLERGLIFAMIKVESNFNSAAQSGAGAVGLMQITPKTAEYIADMKGVEDYDLFNPSINVDFGCYYLKYLILRFKSLDTALYAYNAGEGNVANWLNDKEYSIDGITLQSVPFPETREYTKKIQQTFSKYKKLYGNILDK